MICLSDEQIEAIAEKAAEKAVERIIDDVYKHVGKTLVEKLFWFVGATLLGFGLWLQSKGFIKL